MGKASASELYGSTVRMQFEKKPGDALDTLLHMPDDHYFEAVAKESGGDITRACVLVIANSLEKEGLRINVKQSESNIILEVACDDDMLARALEDSKYRLRLNERVDSECPIACHTPFLRSHPNWIWQAYPLQTVQGQSVLHYTRRIDRLRMVDYLISKQLFVTALIERNIVSGVIPLPDPTRKKEHKISCCFNLPVDDVQERFGEKVALYFFFLQVSETYESLQRKQMQRISELTKYVYSDCSFIVICCGLFHSSGWWGSAS